MTYTEELAQVQAAITAIITGAQSYSIAGRSVNRADLKTLYDREIFLRHMAERENNGGVLGVKYGFSKQSI